MAFGAGMIVVNNLYLVAYVVGLPPGYVFAMVGVVSAMALFRRLLIADLGRLHCNQFAFSLALLSLLCFVVDQAVFGPTGLDLNGPVRVLCLAAYFSWVFSLRGVVDLRAFLVRFAEWSFFLGAGIAFVHFALMQVAPELMNIAYEVLFAEQYLDRISDRRVSGLFIDSNYFATAISLFFFMQVVLRRSTPVVQYLVYAFCINVSGSRLGFVLFAVISIDLFLRSKMPVRIIAIAVIALSVSIGLLAVDRATLLDYEQSGANENLAARLLDTEVAAQVGGSTDSRLTSLRNGFLFGEAYGYLYGPGMLGFDSRWENWVGDYVPHNSLVMMFAQFGVLMVWPLLIGIRAAVLGWRAFGLPYALIFFAPIMLLPFFVYFPIGFLFLFLPQAIIESTRDGRRQWQLEESVG